MSALLLMAFYLFLGRKLGWFLSKVLLYPAPMFLGALVCVVWGVFFAFLTRWTIEWRHVGIVIKAILYLAGAYVAIPDYGLFDESSIPPEHLQKHLTIQIVPTVTYITASIIFAFWVSIPLVR